MRKLIIAVFTLCMFATVLSSCELAGLNQNEKDPLEVPPGALFANSQASIGTFLHQVDVNIGIFQFMAQHWTMTTYTSETRYDLEGRTIAANDWQIMYDALADLKQASILIRNAQGPTTPSPEVQANKQASIEIMQALIYSHLVNIFGYIPYTEALNPAKPLPAYDSGRSVYKSIIDSLNAAISNITTSASGFNTDLYYGGNMKKWKEFGKSLKLRLGIILADVDPAAAQRIVESAVKGVGVFDGPEDNAMVPFENALPDANPVWENVIASGRDDYVPAKPLVSKMNALEDPRRAIWFTKESGKYIGGIYGEQNEYTKYSHFAPAVVLPGRDGLIMGYSEVEFLLAEAAARGFINPATAEDHYRKAIKADMKFWNDWAAAAGDTSRITNQEIEDYLNQPKVDWNPNSANWRHTLGVQKWISLFGQYLMAYTSFRRLDAPSLEPPQKAVRNLKIVPVRFHFPITEKRYNPKNVQAAIQAMGIDEGFYGFTTRLFWDTTPPQ